MQKSQNFPKINLLWLLDGIGSYERNAPDSYSESALLENGLTNVDLSSVHIQDEQDAVIANGQSQSRFFQGELFAENPIFTPESTVAAKNRKEMPLQTPQKAPYLSESQIEYARKSLQRKIVEIKIFFDDGTYETFKP